VRFAWLLVLALGCAGSSREVEAVLAANQQHDRYVEPPTTSTQRPWKLGQWTLYKVATHSRRGYLKHSLVGEARCGFWFETEIVLGLYEDRTTLKVCLRDPPDPRAELAEQRSLIGAYVSRRGDITTAKDLDDPRNADTKDQVVRVLEGFAMFARRGQAEEGRKEIEVPAGQFAGVVRIPARLWLENVAHPANLWFHPEVPLGGITKAVAYDDNDAPVMQVDLLDYGLADAKSELPEFNELIKSQSAP
jgi:hypothetical protein